MRRLLLLGTLGLASCVMPLWRVPPRVPQSESMANPPQSEAAIASVELTRPGCLGPCPVYQFTVNADRPARFDGLCFTPLLGSYEAPLDTATFSRVARLLLKSDYFRSDTLLGFMNDVPMAVIAVTLTDGRRRTVWYGPTHWALAGRIELVMSVLPWRYVAPVRLQACAT